MPASLWSQLTANCILGTSVGLSQHSKTAPIFDEEYSDDTPSGRTGAAFTAAGTGLAASQQAQAKAQREFASSGYEDDAELAGESSAASALTSSTRTGQSHCSVGCIQSAYLSIAHLRPM